MCRWLIHAPCQRPWTWWLLRTWANSGLWQVRGNAVDSLDASGDPEGNPPDLDAGEPTLFQPCDIHTTIESATAVDVGKILRFVTKSIVDGAAPTPSYQEPFWAENFPILVARIRDGAIVSPTRGFA